MPDKVLERFITDAVDHHRPTHQPPFEALETRWRRRRTTRRSITLAGLAVVIAVAVPAALLDRSDGHTPQPSAASASPGPIPSDVTAVSACHVTECRTITDPRQLGLLVDDLNGSGPLSGTYPPVDPRALVVTLTFTGPHASYPVVDVMINSGWWTIRGTAQRYTGNDKVRTSALQALKLGVVVHDCGVTNTFEIVAAPEFVGLTLDAARSLAAHRNLTVRVFGQDGKCNGDPTTADYNRDRVNLYLERGKVTSAARF